MSERKEVYVLGHRNPDTDSICSAIAYADVKNKENDGNHYAAARGNERPNFDGCFFFAAV